MGNISYPQDGDLLKLKKLWDASFPGEEAYREFFFAQIYNKANALIYTVGEEIAAMIHLIPFTLDFQGKKMPVSYVYGVATLPEYRRRGLSRKLMDQAFFHMYLRGAALALLIPQEPWLFDFYKPLGYAPVFKLKKTEIKLPDFTGVKKLVPAGPDDISTLDQIYETALAGRIHISRDFPRWATLLEEFARAGGEISLDNAAGAYAAWTRDPQLNKINVVEIMGPDEPVKYVLISSLQRDAGGSAASVLTPAEPGTGCEFGCARAVDVAQCLSYIDGPKVFGAGSFTVADDYGIWNTARVYQAGEHAAGRLGGEILTVEEFTTQLFAAADGELPPYMNLMHN